ncbi:MAG TPA: hypothetical protein VIJ79_01025 [Acidobacteriaceae bacterium]
MKVDMHIERVGLKLLAVAGRELVFQNEIRQPGRRFEIKAFAHIEVVNIPASSAESAKGVVSTTEFTKTAIIAAANRELSSKGFDVVDAEMATPKSWDVTLIEHKGERRTMGANISNFYTVL